MNAQTTTALTRTALTNAAENAGITPGQARALLEAVREKLPSLLEAAWDDGNALGLDGWTGPERGEEPDEHAIRRRARLRGKLVDEACEAIAAALEVEG